jgi:hypothetical protein
MAKKQEWPINSGFLKNFEEYTKVFSIELSKEVSMLKEEVDILNQSGTYVLQHGKIVAVFKWNNDIYIKINNEIHTIPIDQYTIKVINLSDTKRRFIVSEGKANIIEYDYNRQKYVYFDAWSEEDDVDFFSWLSNMYTSGRLANMY